jgi:DNA invertase Pin-like site-specific DNA recombinase
MINMNRTAIYCRLSKDDEQIGDSVSIETQKMLLSGYCINQDFEIVDTYIDDGFSGLNFNRPSFRRMINDIEDGKIDIVVTKDLSRLGRDYIQTGYYIDVYFSTKHIRYIAVNDGIDTLLNNNDIAPFKNILNDMYAKDLSRKVKSAKNQRAKNGLYISAQPPYGYKVDPHNKNKLIIDDVAAKIVKYIFELVYEGKNYSEISRILENQQIISPSAYKAMHGDTRFIKFTTPERIYKWPYQTIKSIICNRIYVGDMVNHKVETINYKTKERVRVPLEDQIVVSNTHEAIIDREIFEAITSTLNNRRNPNHKYENIFKGLVYCAECGEEMQLIAKKSRNETKPMFRCSKHAIDSKACTHHHFIYYNDLINEIATQLSLQIDKLISSSVYDELYEKIMIHINHRTQEIILDTLQKELQMVNKKIKELYKSLSREIKASELENLYNTQKSLLKKITEAHSNFNLMFNIKSNDIKIMIKKYLTQTPINQNTLNLLIEKIEIGHLKYTSDKCVQDIKIHYRF